MYCINNVKISVLFHSNKPISIFNTIAEKRLTTVVQKRNIVIINDIYSITIFKKLSNKYHINVTGIRSLSLISSVVDWLINSYCKRTDFQLIRYQIDNITATFDIGFSISLHSLAHAYNSSRYNPERFPGLHYKTDWGTAIVFKSGKVNIVGCKSENEIISIWSMIKEKIGVALRKSIS